MVVKSVQGERDIGANVFHSTCGRGVVTTNIFTNFYTDLSRTLVSPLKMSKQGLDSVALTVLSNY